VRTKVRARFGGRLKAMISGGAPLNHDVGLFFTALGVRVLQGYGQTEAAPVIACNPPGKVKLRTVGPPVEGVEVKIADDGEVLVRGPLVMNGYWNNPEATAEVLREGWLNTGDIGRFDEDGYLLITDRKKDIIVISGGDNISPQRVEGILALQPEIAQAMVYGDRHPHLVALIVADAAFAERWSHGHGVPADPAALSQNPEFVKRIAKAVEAANLDLSVIERIKRFALAKAPFTIDNAQLTPTLKLKRHAILAEYRESLEALY
jgi:long-chain acyl-CoA synthetase